MINRVIRAMVKAKISLAGREIEEDDDLKEDLHLDAIDITMLAMALEDDFGIGITDDEINSWGTVADIMQSIVNRRVVL